jgi:transposase-like protein
MIEEEFKIFISREPYERKKQRIKLLRNGYRYRYYLFIWSKLLRIKIPRCREASFRPKVISSKNITDSQIEGMIIQIWAEGCSYRDIQTLVKKIYGESLSLKLLNRITRSVDKYVKQYHTRVIKYSYDCIYIDGLWISIKGFNNRVFEDEYMMKLRKNAVILCVLGQRRQSGRIVREMIDYRIATEEDEQNYTKLLSSLKSRGLSTDKFKIVVSDGDRSIRSSLKKVFGNEILHQSCLLHRTRNILQLLRYKTNKKELKNDIWSTYGSKDVKEFKKRHRRIINKWYKKEPEAISLFKRVDKNILAKYKQEEIDHRYLTTNNPIERRFKEIRRRTKAIGGFENVESADRLLFLIVEYLNQRCGVEPTNTNLEFTH